MAIVVANLTGVSYTYLDRPVLNGVNWEIQDRQRIGLVGPNGGGKSTLLKLVMGRLTPDAGSIFRLKELTIGYLPQENELDPGMTVLEAAMSGSPRISLIRGVLSRCEAQMGDATVYGSPARLDRVMAAHEAALHEYEAAGGLTYENRVQATLRRLGLNDAAFSQPLGTLSGGQIKLVCLTRLVVWQPALLLLDEPDNHLDLDGKQMVEEMVSAYPGAVVIVSHDRFLLDRVVDRIAELDRGQIRIWPGNYSTFAVNKQVAALRQEQMYRAQQKRIGQIEAAIKRFELWASLVVDERHARQARARYKMLERMERIERPDDSAGSGGRMRLDLPGWRGSHKVLEIVGLRQSYGSVALLTDLNLLIWHGERVGLVGPNGAGKSVLLRLILAAAALDGAGAAEAATTQSGTIRLGPSVKVGYYAQQHETLHPDWSVVQEIRDARPMYEADAYAFLGRFLFDFAAAQKMVRQLSGGERSRLQLARLMLSDANFLLLDEPTNHLDIPSAEALEAALEEFNGAVLVVSHDRYFLDRMVDRVVGLEAGTLVEVAGGYSDYLAARHRG